MNLRLLSAACLFVATSSVSAAELHIFPPNVVLQSPESRQQLIVQQGAVDALGPQAVDVVWSSTDTNIVQVSATGIVNPVADGTAKIRAAIGEQSSEIDVTVSGQDQPHAWSFRHDVLPVLSKTGCNMGAAMARWRAKGIRLSLRGYDAVTDHFNIVKQDRGRRIEFADPARSLLLSKPSGAIPHKGGLRFETDSLEYRILAEWIATGAAAPQTDDARLQQIEVFPQRVTLQSGDAQQLIARATYTDGRIADVTPWAKWTSTNEAVCTVNDRGEVEIVGPGEGAVVVWFSSQIVLARITVPYPHTETGTQLVTQEPRNFIDTSIDAQLRRLNVPASPACSDAEFIRRATLDAIGMIPTPEEVRAFLEDASPDKRDRLVDQLLERPEFVDYWTYKWSDVLMLNGTLLRPEALKAYYQWIHGHVAKNSPWDVMVREILTATGSSHENGATNFYALNQTPEDMTENACQSFLGLSINCAKCHNHPLEKWTNDQYYGMANLFARVRAKGWGGEPRNGDGLRTLYVAETGDLVQPRTGKPQPPTPLDGESLQFDDPTDRRIALAEWMTSPENPYFARSITNRVWANYFGVGLVDAEDDMRASNPASNDELLQSAAQFVVDHQFDLKALMREILRSNAYQRSSQPLPGNANEHRFYSRYYPRRLMAEVLHDAVVQVSNVPSKFEFIAFPGADKQKTDLYPEGTRAVQLYDSAIESYFLEAFGRNPRNIVCECERSDEPSMVQVLHISNGTTINDKLKSDASRVTDLVKLAEAGDATWIDEAFLWCFARYPSDRERQQTLEVYGETPEAERRQAVEDLLWALMSSREFLFNH